ncbi:unnamed protein product [Symbiodinium natans]|uniref:Uncharacterized protein n=1 Tax=Symbiodinium natans TaxID=878477 RepID=A0A812IG74_9DINO|nr:unnamed protein product [Symbiodinium natans]
MDLAVGRSVRLHNLNAASLNGRVGTLIQLDERTGRWQVDLGRHDGIKALLPKNLAVEGGNEEHEEEEEEQEPGTLIGRLLGSDGEGEKKANSNELDEIDAIAEGIDEDHMPDEMFDEGDLEAIPELAEAEPAEPAEPAEEEMEEVEPEEAAPEEADCEEAEVEEAEPNEDGGAEAEEAEEDCEDMNDHAEVGQEEFDPEAPPEDPITVEEDGEEEPEAEEPPDFTKMSVKDLKAFLQARAVRIPAWVTEKSDLLGLVKDSAHLPIRPPEERQRKEEPQKAAPEKEPEPAPQASTQENAGPSRPWQPPGGGWPYSTPSMPAPAFPGFTWQQPWGGCQPNLYPQPGFWPRPGGYAPAPAFRPPGPVPVAPVTQPLARPPWPPKSREDAVFYRDHRLRRIGERAKDSLRHFCKKYHISREVETSLQMMDDRAIENLTGDRSLASALGDAFDPHEPLLNELQKRDVTAATVIRWLVPPPKGRGAFLKSPKRSPVRLKSHSRSRRKRSRSRRRDKDRRKSSHRRNSPRRSSPQRSPPSSRPPTPPRPRRWQEDRKSPSPPPLPRILIPVPKSKQGVFRSPSKSPSPPPAPPPPRPAATAAPAPSTNTVHDEAEAEIRRWLCGLDSGRGAMASYAKIITEEFGGVPALSACILPENPKGSVIGRIDASLWEALDVKSLGHRLLLAKGILALE